MRAAGTAPIKADLILEDIGPYPADYDGGYSPESDHSLIFANVDWSLDPLSIVETVTAKEMEGGRLVERLHWVNYFAFKLSLPLWVWPVSGNEGMGAGNGFWARSTYAPIDHRVFIDTWWSLIENASEIYGKATKQNP